MKPVTQANPLAVGQPPQCRVGFARSDAPSAAVFRPFLQGDPPEVAVPVLADIEAFRTSSTSWANVLWGAASWEEPTRGDAVTFQVLDIAIPSASAPVNGYPVLIFFHANGNDHVVAPGGDLDTMVKQAALTAGYAFASVEFRHPVANESEGCPHTDCGLAIQYIRALHDALDLDRDNLFAYCRSRGNLAFWQAVQADMANAYASTYAGRQSSLLKGLFTLNSQIAYSVQGFCDLYIDPADHATILASNPDNPLWQDAIDAIPTATTLPQVVMQHESAYLGETISAAELTAWDAIGGNSIVHFPDAGRLTVAAYAARGMAERISAYDAENGSAAEEYGDIVRWMQYIIEGMASREAFAMARARRRNAQAHYVTDDLVGVAPNVDGSGTPALGGPIGALVAGQYGRANRALGVSALGIGAGQGNVSHQPTLVAMASGHIGIRCVDSTDRLVVNMASDGTPNWVGWTLTGEETTLAAQDTTKYTFGQFASAPKTIALSIGSDAAITANDMKVYRNFAATWAGVNYP